MLGLKDGGRVASIVKFSFFPIRFAKFQIVCNDIIQHHVKKSIIWIELQNNALLICILFLSICKKIGSSRGLWSWNFLKFHLWWQLLYIWNKFCSQLWRTCCILFNFVTDYIDPYCQLSNQKINGCLMVYSPLT